MSDPPLSPVALRQRRDRTIARLCDHFAQDHLEAEELEQLIDRAHRATSLAELDALLADLPALREAASASHLPARPAPAERLQDQQFLVAVMSGVERRGHWTPARRINVLACMGGVELDFRHIELPPGLTEVNVLAVMGGVEITVPPGMNVDTRGIGIMGGFSHSGTKFPVDSAEPTLRVTGLAFMGGVEVRERPSKELPRGRASLPGG